MKAIRRRKPGCRLRSRNYKVWLEIERKKKGMKRKKKIY